MLQVRTEMGFVIEISLDVLDDCLYRPIINKSSWLDLGGNLSSMHWIALMVMN